MIALVFVLIALYEWSDWRKRHNGTTKLWKLVTVIAVLLVLLEAHFLVKDYWNFEVGLHRLYRYLSRWL
ncbi:hypothetical protein YSY43_22600 [Paenibacillus sp. YSY-4.3]